jgi:sirohydrochlorin ferrochelatase
MGPDPHVVELLKAELAAAEAELRAHMASWEYAFAMGSSRDGATNHPLHRKTRERTEQLVIRCRHLRARLAEHEV